MALVGCADSRPRFLWSLFRKASLMAMTKVGKKRSTKKGAAKKSAAKRKTAKRKPAKKRAMARR
jgi:hypothetical protein